MKLLLDTHILIWAAANLRSYAMASCSANLYQLIRAMAAFPHGESHSAA
jgi:PIN domain nuclease of toxin-antitoxin system